MLTVDQELKRLGVESALRMPDDEFAAFVQSRNKRHRAERVWDNPNELLTMEVNQKRVFATTAAFYNVRREADTLGRKFVVRGAGGANEGHVRVHRIA